MSQAFLRRLAALESQIRPHTPPPKPPLPMWLVSFHVGKWQPHESVMEGTIRALGFANAAEFYGALHGDFAGFSRRYEGAIEKMFAREGVDFHNAPFEEHKAAFVRLIAAAERAGMPLPDLLQRSA